MTRELKIFQKSGGNGLAEKVVKTAKNILRNCSNIQRNPHLNSLTQLILSRFTRSSIATSDNNLKLNYKQAVRAEL